MSKLANKKTNQPTSKEQEIKVLAAESVKETPKAKEGGQEKKAVTSARALLRYYKVSPRKVRLVINEIKGLPVMEALARLQLMQKISARDIAKLLKSAIANAENNFKLKKEDLFVKSIVANQGPSLHRFMPAAFGSAHDILKRSSHVDLTIALKEENKKKKEQPVKSKKTIKPEIKKVKKPVTKKS
ncbi:MAG: 50S ribosomal protein L22 [Patescibacteria group bacterium]|jgi:large subunit ribosomal protein L22